MRRAGSVTRRADADSPGGKIAKLMAWRTRKRTRKTRFTAFAATNAGTRDGSRKRVAGSRTSFRPSAALVHAFSRVVRGLVSSRPQAVCALAKIRGSPNLYHRKTMYPKRPAGTRARSHNPRQPNSERLRSHR